MKAKWFSIKKLWVKIGLHIVASMILAFFIMVFIGQAYIVNGASMEETLFSRQRVYVNKISYRFSKPQRGEIIVLKTKEGPFIKRIIAIGGDIIEERDGSIFLNNEPLEECYVFNKTKVCWGPIEVPEDFYWVMGDNRQNSKDSRSCIGFVPRKDIIGKATFRFWPLDQLGQLQ